MSDNEEYLERNQKFIDLFANVEIEPAARPKEPEVKCGDCAAYKTWFCTRSGNEGYNFKKDAACCMFQFDRHLAMNKKKKVKKVMKRLGRR